jgi:hypothetical protein
MPGSNDGLLIKENVTMASKTFTTEERRNSEHFGNAKEAENEALTKAKEAGNELVGAAMDAGADALEKAKETGADVVGKAKQAATAVSEMATSAVSSLGQKADDLAASAGHEIRGLGDKIAQKSPHEGMTGAASQAVADGIKGGGRYLEDAKLSGMAHDVENVIRNHPIPALLLCFGVGVCIGRALRD